MLQGIALLLAGGLAVFVAAPLLASEGEGRGTLPVDVTPLADLKRRRLVLYENIQDLEFEYRAKKIARQDTTSVSQPPSTGPSAPPIAVAPAQVPIALPFSRSSRAVLNDQRTSRLTESLPRALTNPHPRRWRKTPGWRAGL